jgi:hypothetical protein
MARANGILRIEGTLQDMTFYHTQDGNLVKTKGGVSGSRIATDPAFARTRENGVEFGNAATGGKLVRDAFRNLVEVSSDNRVTSRLMKIMAQIKDLDSTSARGLRTVATGIATAAGKALLNGFNFNAIAILGALLFKPYSVDPATGIITIPGLVPITDVAVPEGATDISFSGAFGIVDFVGGTSVVSYTTVQNLAYDATSTDVVLKPVVPVGTGVSFYLLQVSFFQTVNGVQYPLNNGAFNALTVIDVV